MITATVSKPQSTTWLAYLAALMAAVIFVLDTVTPFEIAIAVFYVIIVLMAVGFTGRRGVVWISLGCTALTVVSYLMSYRGAMQAGLINMGISISAIATTGYLALKIDAARQAVHATREQIAHIGRVNALGELSASIAHEINQPLAAIVASGNACLRWLDGTQPNLDKARRGVERMVSDANRASDVIGRVRNLAKRAPPEKSQVDLPALIMETVATIASELDRHEIDLRTEFPATPVRVFGDPVQLQQIVLNLLMNAIEAMTPVEGRRREIVIRTGHDGAAQVTVAVSDTGVGIRPEDAELVFDAFYSTKSGGVGLGLAIVASVIEAHQGRIWLDTGQRVGTTFCFTLPTKPG